MNSQEERELFERWGWRKDYVASKWIAPIGRAEVSTEELVAYSNSAEAEGRLIGFVMRYGKRSA